MNLKLYHGTSTVFLDKIKHEGLRSFDRVYMTADRDEAHGWAQMRVDNLKWRGLPAGRPVVLAVTIPERECRLGWNDRHYTCETAIPPTMVRVLPASGKGKVKRR